MKFIEKLLICVTSITVATCCLGQEPVFKTPTIYQLTNLFNAVTRQMPDNYCILAITTNTFTPPSEAELDQMVKDQNEMLKESDKKLPLEIRQQEARELKDVLRVQMSGKKYFLQKECKIGGLMRFEETERLAPFTNLESNLTFDTIDVALNEKANGGPVSFRINNALKSATIQKDPNKIEIPTSQMNHLVELGDFESLVLFLALGDAKALKQPVSRWMGRVDIRKCEMIAGGARADLDFIVSEELFMGKAVDRFVIGKKEGTKKGSHLEITCDSTNFLHVYKVFIQDLNGRTSVIERLNYDQNEFPHFMRQKFASDDGKETTLETCIIDLNMKPNKEMESELSKFHPPTNFFVENETNEKKENHTGPPNQIREVLENHAFLFRSIMLTVFLLPPLIMLFMAIKKRISK
jgi:hypothetical protein